MVEKNSFKHVPVSIALAASFLRPTSLNVHHFHFYSCFYTLFFIVNTYICLLRHVPKLDLSG